MYHRGHDRRGGFSRRELKHLGAAAVALTLAFLFIRHVEPAQVLADPSAILAEGLLDPVDVAVSVVVVMTGFLFHELAHKFSAQLYGHWSEFRASYPHLLMAVVISLFGVLFAAPGAVNIRGNVSKQENGVISAVGPLTNIAMAAVFIVLRQAYLRSPVEEVFFWGGVFNVALGGFNLLPVKPLDGSKVVRWNVGVYLLLILVIVFQLKLLFPDELFFLP